MSYSLLKLLTQSNFDRFAKLCALRRHFRSFFPFIFYFIIFCYFCSISRFFSFCFFRLFIEVSKCFCFFFVHLIKSTIANCLRFLLFILLPLLDHIFLFYLCCFLLFLLAIRQHDKCFPSISVWSYILLIFFELNAAD